MNRDKNEEGSWSNRSEDTNVSRIPEDYITQVSKEIERKVINQLFPGVQ